MSDSTLFTEVVVTELIETVDESVILETIEVTDLIETPAEQGPRGRDGEDGKDGKDGKDGVDASSISKKTNNRLTKEPDGLYVFDDLAPDPLAYYIISKN